MMISDLKNGACLNYPLSNNQIVTIWEWTEDIIVYNYATQVSERIKHPHWQWIGRTRGELGLKSFNLNPEGRVIMPDQLRRYTQPVDKQEKNALNELFTKSFDTSLEASLAIALNFRFAQAPNRGLVWFEEVENEIVKKEARLKLISEKYQWISEDNKPPKD